MLYIVFLAAACVSSHCLWSTIPIPFLTNLLIQLLPLFYNFANVC